MKLLIKNNANSHQTGDVIFIAGDDHVFGRMESLTKFLENGGVKSDWSYEFVIVNVTGVNANDYKHLLDTFMNDIKKYYIEPQTPTSKYWGDISQRGEVDISKAEFDALIRSRM